MDNHTLDEIVEEAYDREFARYDNLPEHRFSACRKRKMKKIFKLYDKNLEQQLSANLKPVRRLSSAMAIALVLAVLAAISAAAVGIYTNISWKRHSEFDQLFVINYENAPETIDYIYELTALSNDYVIDDEIQSSELYVITWHNTKTDTEIMFQQSIKKDFSTKIDYERGKLETVYIDEKPGLYIDWSNEKRDSGVIVWDNGDYILEIVGNLNKDEMLALAESTKILKNSEKCVPNG